MYPESVETEYYIRSGMTTISGTGRADIVYFNYKNRIAEVYEIKPGSYAIDPRHGQGLSQLDTYIFALNNGNQLKTTGINYAQRGYSLDNMISSFTIDSKMFPNQEIVYNVYRNDGLITYNYRNKRSKKEKCEETEVSTDYVIEEIPQYNLAKTNIAWGSVALGVALLADDLFTAGAGTIDDPIALGLIAEGLMLY